MMNDIAIGHWVKSKMIDRNTRSRYQLGLFSRYAFLHARKNLNHFNIALERFNNTLERFNHTLEMNKCGYEEI